MLAGANASKTLATAEAILATAPRMARSRHKTASARQRDPPMLPEPEKRKLNASVAQNPCA